MTYLIIIVLVIIIGILLLVIRHRIKLSKKDWSDFVDLAEKLKESEEKLKENEEKLKECDEIVKLFDEPKPRISYDEWYRNKYIVKPTYTKFWNDYWDEICKDEYCAWYIRKISIYPKFLINLINEIKKFDFDKVSEHMKSVNWTWERRHGIPTTKDMIDCVFSLAFNLKTQDDKDGCSSGGFCVKRMTDDKAEITFKYNSYIPD